MKIPAVATRLQRRWLPRYSQLRKIDQQILKQQLAVYASQNDLANGLRRDIGAEDHARTASPAGSASELADARRESGRDPRTRTDDRLQVFDTLRRRQVSNGVQSPLLTGQRGGKQIKNALRHHRPRIQWIGEKAHRVIRHRMKVCGPERKRRQSAPGGSHRRGIAGIRLGGHLVGRRKRKGPRSGLPGAAAAPAVTAAFVGISPGGGDFRVAGRFLPAAPAAPGDQQHRQGEQHGDRLGRSMERYLDDTRAYPVRDPLWGNIYLPDVFRRLIETPAFVQLHRIRQLGPSFLVYPGATHTRASHSLGVFYVARRMIDTIRHLPDGPRLSTDGIGAFLAAALLHDCGHFPYTHSLKELPLEEHESLGARLIQADPVASVLREDAGIDPGMVADIVDPDRDAADPEVNFYRSLLSGALDPDKLDYLTRDAYFCGVPYGVQDLDYVLTRLRADGYGPIGIRQSGVSVIEHLLFAKYLMYRAVYWHPTVRIATGMIKAGLYQGLAAGAFRESELYGLDDETFYRKFGESGHPGAPLVAAVFARRFHTVAAEIPMEAIPDPQRLLALDARTSLATSIGRDVGLTGNATLIIDVPEAVSFEVDIPVWTARESHGFREAGSVFTPDVVRDFTRRIRIIRLALPPEASEDQLADARNLLYSELKVAADRGYALEQPR